MDLKQKKLTSDEELIAYVKSSKELCPLCQKGPMQSNKGAVCPFPHYLYCPACEKVIGLDPINWTKCFTGVSE